VGPGRGALTEHLLKHADRVVAIELDSELALGLRSRWAGDSRIEIVEGDAAAMDLTVWGDGILAGNLPYYVATSIISRYLRRPGGLRRGTFLIQEEVAARITARPGTREYGYLSVECQFLGRPEYLFRVPPGAFQPPPKVHSAVIRISPRTREDGVDADAFLRFVSVCFRQKRKTLRNNLAAAYPREAIDSRAGLSRRAEELSIEEFLELYRALNTQHRRYDAL
jgi:16S rRNA (adenine1518-N6/adenine1519-N6)-dimethyltransferase